MPQEICSHHAADLRSVTVEKLLAVLAGMVRGARVGS